MTLTNRSLAAGAIAGALGGLAGTAAMAACDAVWSMVDDTHGSATQRRRLRRSGVGRRQFPQSEPRSHEGHDTPSEYLARKLPWVDEGTVAERAVGSAIHFAFGATAGAAYGAAVASAPPHVARLVRSGHGLTYGTLVWLLADEIGIPFVGLGPPPHRSSPRMHAYALAGHFAYGIALETVRRLVTSTPVAKRARSRSA